MDDIPYLLRGVVPVETMSSVLISSSRYLNNPRLRDWLAMILLRKNGADMPPKAEMHEFLSILDCAIMTGSRRCLGPSAR